MRASVLASISLLLVVLVVGLPVHATALGGGQAGQEAEGVAPATTVLPQIQSAELEQGQVIMSFYVRADGSAYAGVSHWIALDDQTSVEAFQRLKEEVRNNRSAYVERFERRIQQTVRNAERATSREMAIRNITVRATRSTQDYGVVEYTFEWEGFALGKGDRLTIGSTLGGLHLGESTRLVVSWPTDYELGSVGSTASDVREHTAIWTGPQTFGYNGPHLVLRRQGGILPTLTSYLGLFAGGVGIVALSGMLVLWRRRSTSDPVQPLVALVPGLGIEADAGEDAGNGAADSPEEAGAGAGAAGEAAVDTGPDIADTPRELLSNNEALLQELQQRGGREKQQELVEALDWSNAKGSRVINDLRDEEKVETFRLGNENVVTLSGIDIMAGEEEEPPTADGGNDD